jgi:hypothetical protein
MRWSRLRDCLEGSSLNTLHPHTRNMRHGSRWYPGSLAWCDKRLHISNMVLFSKSPGPPLPRYQSISRLIVKICSLKEPSRTLGKARTLHTFLKWSSSLATDACP